jgi:hypothetical protein
MQLKNVFFADMTQTAAVTSGEEPVHWLFAYDSSSFGV